MKISRIFLVLLLFVMASLPLFGQTDGKTLIYYFKNLTGDQSYNDLMYKIPVCLYNRLGQDSGGRDFSIIDERGLQAYYEDDSIDLWDMNYLLNITNRKKINKVMFGFFYSKGDRIAIQGKIYFTESGLMLEINEDNSEYYPIYREIEEFSVEDIRNCNVGEKNKAYKPPVKSITEVQKPRAQRVISTSMGTLFPTGAWNDIYRIGIYSDISYVLFPRRDRVPLGFGAHTGFILLNRKEDKNYLGSETMIIPYGCSIHYAIIRKGFIDRVVADFAIGFALSKLYINYDTLRSADIYTKGSLSFVFNFKKYHVTVMAGLLTVGYKDSPMNAFFSEIGFRFYDF